MISELTEKPQRLTSSEGTTAIWTPRAGLVLTQVSGRLTLEHAEVLMRAVDRVVAEAPGRTTAIHDWLGVESFELAVQARMTAWSVAVHRSFQRVVVGVRSPFVALAVRTANLAAGGRFEVIGQSEPLRTIARYECSRPDTRGVATSPR